MRNSKHFVKPATRATLSTPHSSPDSELIPYMNLKDLITREYKPQPIRCTDNWLDSVNIFNRAFNDNPCSAMARSKARDLLKKICKANPNLVYLASYSHIWDKCKVSYLSDVLADLTCKLFHKSNSDVVIRFGELLDDLIDIASISLLSSQFAAYKDTSLGLVVIKLAKDNELEYPSDLIPAENFDIIFGEGQVPASTQASPHLAGSTDELLAKRAPQLLSLDFGD